MLSRFTVRSVGSVVLFSSSSLKSSSAFFLAIITAANRVFINNALKKFVQQLDLNLEMLGTLYGRLL